jgi:hypothetical protein
MLPKKGNQFRERITPKEVYAGAIADALRTELGQSHRATKTLMRWTGASDRTAKNWLSGACGPSGDHLVTLAKESDAVLAALLGLAGRHQHMVGVELLIIRKDLLSAITLIDGLLGTAAL